MHLIENELYHIYNRGNNKQKLFFRNEDYATFFSKLHRNVVPYCDVLTWCIMPNHFHLMIMANRESCRNRASFGGKPMQELPYRIGMALSSYSQQINKQQQRTGSLFQQKTKAIAMSDEMQRTMFKGSRMKYITNLMHYHHYNPVKAGLVSKMEDWYFSSFQDYAGLRKGSFCNVNLLLEMTGYNTDTFYVDSYAALKLL